MKIALPSQLSAWLSPIHPQIWVLVIARFLSEVGSGFTVFYAPIFFVNQVGLSATAVGFGLASAATSGFFGRILGGSLTDSPKWGRRRTLLLAMAVLAMGSLVLATITNFTTLIIGNLIYGLGMGIYWPATEAIVADSSQVEHRREAFALTRLADHLGLAIGSVLAGVLITIAQNYRWLFIVDAISFMVFFAVVYLAIKEPGSSTTAPAQQQFTVWIAALSDRRFLTYIAVNVFFTIYISQIHNVLPIYLKNFLNLGETGKGFDEATISALFAWHLVLAIICQMPVTSILKRSSHTLALTISAVFWAIGFSLIWITSTTSSHQLIWVILALAIFAIAGVSYTPSAASLVSDLSPESQRGVYFSINSLCWAAGSFIGSPLGGWALDQPQAITQNLWLGFVLSVAIALTILQYLNHVLGNGQ
ncbi:Major facilitator superfamily MFS_1 [Trichormus variabilis ATCC 29413]|uniref:Major facilitator superfamily MFS_1 n=2 Tax=Anabaena variabilis TaxID=264691 RepID=Q3M3C2_TRIV2|nr:MULTISPECIES: MFS transporter [Nostocaceae]ABA24514.1 Major facilitator superfamily MFS_1 [Trichormus variabilis ATCC 29413]MBC1212886.1 MFS transporter [Trichormus variabilis ARAD]MBC1257097.1 MFS transporter [Trichormus variabilis V5]MBC1267230.1 MFS transporter [Trichormus variabilis FSR]MBC1301332.1 MFS transporter [Trichormus variabilis N2B]